MLLRHYALRPRLCSAIPAVAAGPGCLPVPAGFSGSGSDSRRAPPVIGGKDPAICSSSERGGELHLFQYRLCCTGSSRSVLVTVSLDRNRKSGCQSSEPASPVAGLCLTPALCTPGSGTDMALAGMDPAGRSASLPLRSDWLRPCFSISTARCSSTTATPPVGPLSTRWRCNRQNSSPGRSGLDQDDRTPGSRHGSVTSCRTRGSPPGMHFRQPAADCPDSPERAAGWLWQFPVRSFTRYPQPGRFTGAFLCKSLNDSSRGQ